MSNLVAMLRAAGDPTRLRLLLLLRHAELTVSELIEIIGQSQPRVSRHLKLLCEADLLERFKEGSWVFHRTVDEGPGAELVHLLGTLADRDDPVHALDAQRLTEVREKRAEAAAAFFKTNAKEWNSIRALHAPEKEVEEAIFRRLSGHKINNLLDAGTGTGRMLELLGPIVRRAVGIDSSPEMLAIARDKLTRAGLANCRVRLGDVYRLPFAGGNATGGFDCVMFQQVLHYLENPAAAVAEAARVLKKGGRLMIADFAPHTLEFLRDEFAHRRLGFSDKEVLNWMRAAGLEPEDTEAIAPHGGVKGKLTVKIWLAAKAGQEAKDTP